MHQLVSQRRMHRQWSHQMPVPKRPIQQIKAPQMSIRPTQRSKPMPKGPMHHIKNTANVRRTSAIQGEHKSNSKQSQIQELKNV